MKCIATILLLFCIGTTAFGQQEDPDLELSIQTSLLAYTTEGGWSAWATFRHNQNRFSLAFVNFPNRYSEDYETYGVQDDDRFIRLQVARHFKPQSKLKDMYIGANFQYHFRQLSEEGGNTTLDATGVKMGAIIGYDWRPWCEQKNAFRNLSFGLWAGLAFLLGDGFTDVIVFPDTGTVYPARECIEFAAGLMVGYTLFRSK